MSTNTVFLSVLLLVSARAENSPQSWEEIQEGQCLSIEEMQAISGVNSAGLYSGVSCDDVVPEGGSVSRLNSCELIEDYTFWSSEYTKHDKAGIFFPFPVPCAQSVTSLDLEYREYETIFPPENENQCEYAQSEEVFLQKEIFRTKKFSAGQGELYLPHPLQIYKYQSMPFGNERFNYCESTEVFMEYKGWGKLEANVDIRDCYLDEQKLCRKAKMKASEKEDGTSCVLIQKIEDCDGNSN